MEEVELQGRERQEVANEPRLRLPAKRAMAISSCLFFTIYHISLATYRLLVRQVYVIHSQHLEA